MRYYGIHEASKLLGVTAQTLRNWNRNGKLLPTHTASNGYRYYSSEQLEEITNAKKRKSKIIVAYLRINNPQSNDLEQQKSILEEYIKTKKYKNYELVKDVGGGISYNKPGFKKIIEKINNKEVEKLILLNKENLMNYGFELIEYFASINSCGIEIINRNSRFSQNEIFEELVHIISEFSSKLHGEPKRRTKKLLEVLSNN